MPIVEDYAAIAAAMAGTTPTWPGFMRLCARRHAMRRMAAIPSGQHPPATPPREKMSMKHLSRVAAALLATAWLLVIAAGNAASQIAPTAPPPKPETLKIADNVYAFRYGSYQSMFVVTSDGVIATDPISYARPEASEVYISEIRKITQSPIKYVVYSHHHYDHIAGGKPFKDAGAIFIAHRNAKLHLEQLNNPNVVIPDEVVDGFRAIELGGARLVPTIAEVRVMWFTKIENHIRHLPVLSPVAVQ
jgi:hypothetical protein